MSLSENLKNARLRQGLSQELTAERIGVSRQAVTKWETGQTRPSARNLSALAELYQVPVTELLNHREGPNLILRANLIKLAIVTQAAFLNSCAWHLYTLRSGLDDSLHFGALYFSLAMLAASSIWMASNHRFEPDPVRRRQNTRIELAYCVVQAALALFNGSVGTGLVGTAVIIAIMLFYLLYVNPKYMGRKLTK